MKRLYSKKSNRQSWPIRAVAVAVVIGLTGSIAQAATTTNRKQIGDLEIYKAAKPGTASIFMMLDTSGSMDKRSIGEDYAGSTSTLSCSEYYLNSQTISAIVYERKSKLTPTGKVVKDEKGNPVQVLDVDNIKDTITFTPLACDYYSNARYSRLTRLQIALIELLADRVNKSDGSKKDTGTLPDDYAIGLGNYSYNGNGRSGVVLVPTGELSSTQRVNLIKKVKELEATGGTPTAHALAESGAYMMGTTTDKDSYIYVASKSEYQSNKMYYYQCTSIANSPSFDNYLKRHVRACNSWGTRSQTKPSTSNYDSYIDTVNNGGNYYKYSINSDSGFLDSESMSKREDLNTYLSPLNPKECSGNGIYLLTDGQPELRKKANTYQYETENEANNRAKVLMNNSLLGSISLPERPLPLKVNSCNGLTGGSASGAWGCMAEYAALLRNPVNNPLKLPIKTATVGFGKDFAGLTEKRNIIINGKAKTVVDCEKGSNVNENTRNLCKLGERKGDNELKTFGDGGFYYTEESSEIAASIVDFASGLVQIINTAPSGTITIPEDPYRAANQLPYAYLPMLDPNIASASSIWRGNLKKYALNQGTLFGNDSKRLYKDVAGNLDETTQDLWQTADFQTDSSVANNNIMAGGVYAQLVSPSSGINSMRTIYVEDTLEDKKTPILRKLSVKDGIPDGFNNLVDPLYTQDNEINKRRLLSFLGFDMVLTNDGQPTSETKVKDLKLTRPTKEIKVLGGVVHSKPEAISYSANLDKDGRITNTRDDYVLFGSMDGALHLVDADKGKEEFAIIPKSMIIAQPTALVEGSIKDSVGEPYFGIDAPWLVTTDYDFDLSEKQVKVEEVTGKKGMFAYGGLRMGGEAFYGMNITKKSEPKILFTITPAGLSSSTAAKSTTSGFERLGQIWSKPTEAKIRMTKDADPINVLVFGGGYDMNYEDDSYVPTSSAPAKGNAIYIINAQSGELIWSTSGETGGTKNVKSEKMINSLVGGITVLDRDNDGLMDHLYAADLGGQMFRADFENARPAKFGFTAVNNFSNKRVTRILDTAPATEAFKKYAYRFYERPVVSFYRNEGISGQTVANNGKLFALVNVISGNRSAPLSTLRNTNEYANRVYGIIDTDVTNADLYKNGFTPSVVNITEGKLVNLASTLGATPSEADKNTAKVTMVKGSMHGWFYPLTRFDGYNNVRHNKGMGDSAVINNLLYTTVYNPDKQYGNVASCAAKISGGSERQLYCLPYGICMDATSVSGTGGYIPAGQGIQELTLGAYNKDNTDVKVLIGTTTITDRIDAAKRAGYGVDGKKKDSNIKDLYPGEDIRPTETGGDGAAAEFLFNERYTLQPRAWYERK